MLPDKEWNKIKTAIASGSLKLRILTDEEYQKIERKMDHGRKKAEKDQAILYKSGL